MNTRVIHLALFLAGASLVASADTSAPTGSIYPNIGSGLSGASGGVLAALIQLPSSINRDSRQYRELAARSMSGFCVTELQPGSEIPCSPMDFVVSDREGKDVGFFRITADGSFTCVLPRPGSYRMKPRSSQFQFVPGSSEFYTTGVAAILKIRATR